MKKPLILISNDDGVTSKGIACLIDAVRPLGEVFVMAPDGPRSGAAAAITTQMPITAEQIHREEGLSIFSSTGTPADCVKLALSEYLTPPPDLVLSGINHGYNGGICVNYSGTVGAAIEGCIFGVPSIAISLEDHDPLADFSETLRTMMPIIEYTLANGLPKGTFLNFNVPKRGQVKGTKICRQAEGKFMNEFERIETASGREIFRMTGSLVPNHPKDMMEDFVALKQGYATLVPCRIDMTDDALIPSLKVLEG